VIEALKGLTNCSYPKIGFDDTQPDVSVYIGENADVVLLGTTILKMA
jgi:hypothetical protein